MKRRCDRQSEGHHRGQKYDDEDVYVVAESEGAASAVMGNWIIVLLKETSASLMHLRHMWELNTHLRMSETVGSWTTCTLIRFREATVVIIERAYGR
jgi:hypothetical protein